MEQQLWFDKYRPIRLISVNGETEVFLAEQVKLQQSRIIKRTGRKSAACGILTEEMQYLRQLSHPCIPSILDTEEDEHYLYLVEEYMKGIPLREYLLTSNITFDEVLNYAIQLCDVASYLHRRERKIVHCDIQPDNLLIDEGQLKLIDFGAAMEPDRVIGDTNRFGTKAFSAPEQSSGQRFDERTDIFSIGRIIQYMLTDLQTNQKGRGLVKKLQRIALRCTQELPSRRYPSADEVKDEISGLLAGQKREKKTSTGSRETCVIGIIGTHRGAGVTHISLLLANYLKKVYKAKVAVIELSGHKSFEHLRTKNDDTESALSPCRIQGIDYFPNADSLLTGTLRNEDYDYCILDLGDNRMKNETELLRCHHKFIITGSDEWHTGQNNIIDELGSRVKRWETWCLILNLSQPKTAHSWKKMPMRVECLGFSPNPFSINEHDKSMLQQIVFTLS